MHQTRTSAVAVLLFVAAARAQVCTSPPPFYAQLESPRNTVVRVCTTEGPIDLELFDAQAPISVANFLSYVRSGRYNNTFIHRSSFSGSNPFVVQGGGWSFSAAQGLHEVFADAPIVREVTGRSNTIRTVGVARGAIINSGTSQFYINTNNNLFLDPTIPGQGYAVFARVVQGWDVVTGIQSRPSQDFTSDPAFVPLGANFGEVPVRASYIPGHPVSEDVLIQVGDVEVVSLPLHCSADFNRDGDVGTDADIDAFFACLSGTCCATCPPNADFNGDGDIGTDADIESFFSVLGGGPC